MSELLKEMSKIKLKNKNLMDTSRLKIISQAVYNSTVYSPACLRVAIQSSFHFFTHGVSLHSVAVLFSRLARYEIMWRLYSRHQVYHFNAA